jgi:hypothetical protein
LAALARGGGASATRATARASSGAPRVTKPTTEARYSLR